MTREELIAVLDRQIEEAEIALGETYRLTTRETDFGTVYDPDDEYDPYECLYPGRCVMPGVHLGSECHTAEMMEQINEQIESGKG